MYERMRKQQEEQMYKQQEQMYERMRKQQEEQMYKQQEQMYEQMYKQMYVEEENNYSNFQKNNQVKWISRSGKEMQGIVKNDVQIVLQIAETFQHKSHMAEYVWGQLIKLVYDIILMHHNVAPRNNTAESLEHLVQITSLPALLYTFDINLCTSSIIKIDFLLESAFLTSFKNSVSANGES
jgi:hypothetical protein